MCLYKTHFLPKISFKPIEVYKVLFKEDSNKYETPFQLTKVFLNTIMKAKKHWETSLFKKSIHGEGVHAYRDLASAFKQTFNFRRSFGKNDFVVIKAIIPRFTVYWIGDDGDIAASKLYITDKFIIQNEKDIFYF